MQFPESWLRAFCNPPLSTAALAELLTMSGLEVESLRPVAPAFHGIVVGAIVAAAPHPNADKLQVCSVDAGSHSAAGLLQVVCGAPNARPGIRVPLALVGAELPRAADAAADVAPFKINVGKLRGVESFGMLCSARELGLSDDHGGLLELPADAPVGADVRDVLNLDDTLFTLKLTPNLAHALSVYGIAREVSALTGSPLAPPPGGTVAPTHTDVLPVRIEAPDLCGRFSGRIVRGVDPTAPTPAWMVERLARCGQRSVSALVDISNYVMFELGRPSHIFDLDKIAGGLVVRWGQAGESLKLLNGQTVEVDAGVGVIGDEHAVESLAGIMGGDATAVGNTTRNVYVETAFWWPEAVQGRSRRYGFSTDAGHRFERGVDAVSTVAHLERITQLVLEICGGAAGPIDDHVQSLPKRPPVTLRVARASKVIGMPLTQAQCADVMRRLGLEFTEGQGTLSVTPPSWRFDLLIEEDLIEELIRVIGYANLPATPPLAPTRARPAPEARRSVHALRREVAGLGYQETINFSFVEAAWEHGPAGNAEPIAVLNPIAAPLAVMRSSLVASLASVLRYNLARRAERVRVFEIGRVYRRDATAHAGATQVAGVAQPLRIAGLAYGPVDELQWGAAERNVDFFDVKGDVQALLAPLAARWVAAKHSALHPGRSARLEVEGRTLGWCGELHPRWCRLFDLPHAPVVFELDLEATLARPVPQAQPVPKMQSVARDVSLLVPLAVAHDALIETAMADGSGLTQSARLFDLYLPAHSSAASDAGAPAERRMALRIELRDDTVTLTDGRIEEAVRATLQRLQNTLGVRARLA